jgi:choline dehydrogenase-like flavoprotein
VVDGNGRVFSATGAFENLFIADGSVIPCATIVNPSWTITAVAEHIAHYIATQVRL